MMLDDLDKKILHEICSGIYSYDDLGKKLNVTRSTIYRRIENLEKENMITKKIMAIPNFENLNLSAILVAITASYDEASQCIQHIKELPNTNLLYRCYGAHQAYAHLICQKGDEAQVIEKIQIALKDQKTISYTISVGFRLEKIDLAPF
jgi:DNA-binding Lrp family transcriptional regulator